MSSKTRKRNSTVHEAETENGFAPGSASQASNWTAPDAAEFASLKRYNVWLAHHGSHLADYTPPPNAKKARRGSDNGRSSAGDGNGDDASEDAQAASNDARWRAGLWLGKIIEIRAKDTSYVWIKIRWMCRNVKELRDQNIKSGLPKGKFGGREIFQLGAEFDALQPVASVEAHASVILYDESNPMQEPFGERDIFYRSEARTVSLAEAEELGIRKPAAKGKGRKAEPASDTIGHLFPFVTPTCYCGDGYVPLSDHTEPMALCSNEGCGKWFHMGCLDWKATHRRTATDSYKEYVRTSGLHLLHNAASSSTPVTGPDFKREALGQGQAKGESNGNGHSQAATAPEPSASDDMPEIDSHTLERYAKIDGTIPAQIRLSAESAISRGDRSTGIVGNARRIVAAREIIALNRQVQYTVKSPGKAIKTSPKVKKEIATSAKAEAGIDGEIAAHESPEAKLIRLMEQWHEAYDQDEPVQPRSVIWLCPSCRKAM